MIYDLPIGNIVENDIKILIDEHVGEQKYLEYKRMLPDHTNESKHKFKNSPQELSAPKSRRMRWKKQELLE